MSFNRTAHDDHEQKFYAHSILYFYLLLIEWFVSNLFHII